ncbi:photosystem II 11 kD protein [Bathycoccus prasinos]|uniref:Photosystem II 11 kD protein n=1 Tax=Bathycoccus prasinos TaxID=41875 RepID=K8E9D7_9CHLO|nr:photosystem II 11 kD protein [Bathycoccus prasinos]CCO14229.1 photosystem II 11 kD protein [Bathycoccus prasinos]|eukprot:XP_007515350.1 photosystem II 11 kD protein [Bathycoccus prasinos]
MDEKFDRREMLKNALVASVGVVAATPMPVRSFVRLVLPMISRVFMCFVVFRLDHQKAEKETRRESAFALALFGIGEKSDAKYEEDTKEVINQVREVLDFPMGADGREQSIEKTRALTNEWVARYRRSGDYSGRPSYGLTYSALNAVSGHFNNFGTKYPFPAKRKDRVFEELTSAETQISRGR